MRCVFFALILSAASLPALAQTCSPVNEFGMQCLSQVDSDAKINQSTGAVNYTITFENRCDRPISVRAVNADGKTLGNSVSPGGRMTLNCVNCGGFVSWYPKCYNN